MTTLSGARITVDLPPGWEGAIEEGRVLDDGAVAQSLTHIGNYPLPASRGTYGAGAVDVMGPGDALIVLLEFEPASASQPLFATSGMPRTLRGSDFSRVTLQKPIEGQGGTQHFFHETGRAFCLYVVVGSHFDRADVIPDINRVLAGVRIGP